MRKFLKFILLLVSFLLAVALAGVYGLSFLEPERIGILAFTWFAFPYLWIVCGVVFIYALLRRNLISVIILALSLFLTWHGMASIVNFGTRPESNGNQQIKIMSFNVRFFNGSQNKPSSVDPNAILHFIDSVSPDVICLQEVAYNNTLKDKGFASIEDFFKDYKYVVRSTRQGDAHNARNEQVIVSRFPLTIAMEDSISDELNSLLLVADAMVGDRKVRIFNAHLASIKLSAAQISAVGKARKGDLDDGTKQNLRETRDKMWSAFVERAVQVRKLRQLIDCEDVPTIVCGDFNDTPISYTYQTVSPGLGDAFMEASGGFSNTYNGKLPPLRIDYILYSDAVYAVDYQEYKVDLSDHFPISAVIEFR